MKYYFASIGLTNISFLKFDKFCHLLVKYEATGPSYTAAQSVNL